MGRPKKTEDDGLPEGFAESVASMSTDEIRRKMSDVMLLDMAMHDVMDRDDKYQSAKEAFEQVAHNYKEDFKSFKLQIKCCKRILDEKNGGAIRAKLEEDHLDAKKTKREAGLKQLVKNGLPTGVESVTISTPTRSVVLTADTRKRVEKALNDIKNPSPGATLTSVGFAGDVKDIKQ
jgi:hypothetical protein